MSTRRYGFWATVATIATLWYSSQSYADPVLHYPGYSIELIASGVGAATGMAISPTGDLYLTDLEGFRVLRIQNPSSTGPHALEVYATGIPYPNDLTFAFGGRLFVTSSTSSNSLVIEVVNGGNTQPFANGFSYPVGIATLGSFIYVANSGNGTISKVDDDGYSMAFLSGFAGPNGPFGVSFDAEGNLYFVVHGSGEVYKAGSAGMTQLLGKVSAFGGVFAESTPEGDVFVSDVLNGSLYLLDNTGINLFASGFAGKSNPPYNGPNDTVVSSSGTIYVADADKVWRISRNPTNIAIDIKPGSFPNSINLKSEGVVPVAILGSASFNIVDVVIDTVNFAGASSVKFSYEDVSLDGILDLILHFHTRELQLTSISEGATLTGQLSDGSFIMGTDSVRIVPPN